MALTLLHGKTVQLFDPQDVRGAMEKVDGPQAEGQRRVYQKMLDAGPDRFVSAPTGGAALDAIVQSCPHFAGVVEDLANYVALAAVRKEGFALTPILLAGDPGVGKTHFSKCLAQALNLSHHFISMGTLSANWVLSGSAPTWQGARHGKVAGALIDAPFANPLFLLDELDKTGGDSRFDPFGALLQLMERDTATHFRDEYLDVPLNMSKVVWISTANDISRVPDFILSRMSVYEVPAPTRDEARAIANNVYSTLRKEHDYPFPPELDDDTLSELETVVPRQMTKRILDGMASTVRMKGERLTPAGVRASHEKTARGIGFLA